MCNQTCVDECEVVREYLTEDHYQSCLNKRCGCSDIGTTNQFLSS